MTIPLQPSLLDEQVARALAAMCRTVAAAPGKLYPVVYVGPLSTPDVLATAAEAACAARAVPYVAWRVGGAPPRAGTVVLCSLADIGALRASAHALDGVQVVVWGGDPAHSLPDDARAALDGLPVLHVDPRNGGGLDDSARTAAQVERIAGGGATALVLLAAEGDVELASDEAQLHIEAAGLRPVALLPDKVGVSTPFVGDGWVVTLGDASGADAVAGATRRCCAAGVPLVVVATRGGWDALRSAPGWSSAAGSYALIQRAGATAEDTAASNWPPVPAMWVGAPESAAVAPRETMILPEGASLLEALGYADVGGRAARIVAWCSDRLAVAAVAQPDAGASVEDVWIAGIGNAADREAALRWLDEVRSWPGARLAVVSGGLERQGPISETVQRVGFYFSRLDDERAGGARRTPARAVAIPVHRVAEALVSLGLSHAARSLLRDAERQMRWGVEEEILLGYLVADGDPDEAIMRLRHAAFRLAASEPDPACQALQTDATLNALLLMVRSRQVQASDAWGSVERWLTAGSIAWVTTARHAAVLFELATRAGRADDARRFVEMFRAMAPPSDPLAIALRAAIAASEGTA